ncbi:MAG: periplasmic heavy metal sensor [Alphaproteobacteria bacterium]|nr:periplasmic heavy metal sensor [Alphaproteobacteria bacterium]
MISSTRIWRAVLVGSLALNLFIAGFVVAQFARGDKVVTAPAAARAAQPLSAQAPEVRRVVEQNNKVVRPNLVNVRKANEAVSTALLAEPFDAERMTKALERLRSATLTSQKALHGAMMETVAAMSPEQRRQLAEATKRTTAERIFLLGQ